jgi:hypothetical protein
MLASGVETYCRTRGGFGLGYNLDSAMWFKWRCCVGDTETVHRALQLTRSFCATQWFTWCKLSNACNRWDDWNNNCIRCCACLWRENIGLHIIVDPYLWRENVGPRIMLSSVWRENRSGLHIMLISRKGATKAVVAGFFAQFIVMVDSLRCTLRGCSHLCLIKISDALSIDHLTRRARHRRHCCNSSRQLVRVDSLLQLEEIDAGTLPVANSRPLEIE